MTTIAEVQDSIRSGIRSLGATASTAAVYWTDEPQPAAKVLVSLDIVNLAAIQDRETYNTDGDSDSGVDWELSSLYYIRVQIRAEAVFNASGHDALFTLEKIRAGLRRPDLVWEEGVVNQPDEVTYVHHVSFPFEGRTISAYSFETGFRAVIDFPIDVPPVDAGVGILEVVVDGDVELDDGHDPVTVVDIDYTVQRP